MSTTFELRIKEGDGAWQTVASKEFTVLTEEQTKGQSTAKETAVAVWGPQSTEDSLLDWDAALIHVDQLAFVSLKKAGSGLYTYLTFKIPKGCSALIAGRGVSAADWTTSAGGTGYYPDVIYLYEELGAETTLTARLLDTTEGA